MAGRRLTKRDFESTVKRMNLTDRGVDMARRVLVGGEMQQTVADDYEVTAGAVSQHVSRVWRTYVELQEIPVGWEKITAVLPADKAEIVRTWEKTLEPNPRRNR